MAKFKQRTSSHKVKNYSVYSRFCYKYTIPISRECVCMFQPTFCDRLCLKFVLYFSVIGSRSKISQTHLLIRIFVIKVWFMYKHMLMHKIVHHNITYVIDYDVNHFFCILSFCKNHAIFKDRKVPILKINLAIVAYIRIAVSRRINKYIVRE